MKLITELNEEVGVLTESTKEGKNYFFEGPFIQCEIKNRNGRKYSKSSMLAEVTRYNEEQIKTNRAVGELNHPTSPTINYERACHKIISLVEEGNNFIGRSKVLTELPMGMIIKGLISEGVQFGTSTRGVGSLKTNGDVTEVYNYRLSTAADVVSDPSAGAAWMQSLVEGAEWIYDPISGHYLEQQLGDYTDKVKKLVHTTRNGLRAISEEEKIRLFKGYLDIL
jgi:hypothetical protein